MDERHETSAVRAAEGGQEGAAATGWRLHRRLPSELRRSVTAKKKSKKIGACCDGAHSNTHTLRVYVTKFPRAAGASPQCSVQSADTSMITTGCCYSEEVSHNHTLNCVRVHILGIGAPERVLFRGRR